MDQDLSSPIVIRSFVAQFDGEVGGQDRGRGWAPGFVDDPCFQGSSTSLHFIPSFVYVCIELFYLCTYPRCWRSQFSISNSTFRERGRILCALNKITSGLRSSSTRQLPQWITYGDERRWRTASHNHHAQRLNRKSQQLYVPPITLKKLCSLQSLV